MQCPFTRTQECPRALLSHGEKCQVKRSVVYKNTQAHFHELGGSWLITAQQEWRSVTPMFDIITESETKLRRSSSHIYNHNWACIQNTEYCSLEYWWRYCSESSCFVLLVLWSTRIKRDNYSFSPSTAERTGLLCCSDAMLFYNPHNAFTGCSWNHFSKCWTSLIPARTVSGWAFLA